MFHFYLSCAASILYCLSDKDKMPRAIKTPVLIIALLILSAGIAQAGDWPMFHHDLRHTGYTNETIPDDLELLWSFETAGEVVSSPAVADGKVFVGSCDDKIYCLDENTGRLLWSFETAGEVASSPAVVDGKVFVGSCDIDRPYDNKIYCLDENTGELIWSFETGDDVHSSPAVTNGKVFVGSHDSNIYCLDENTGELIWSFETGGYLVMPRYGYNRIDQVWSSPAVVDGKVFVGSDSNYIYCLDETTGEKIWHYQTGDEVFSSPAVANGKVFIGSRDNKIYCFGLKAFEDALSVINNTQTAINSAKSIGADTTEAEKLLQKAEAAVKEGKYEEAENYANQAKESAEKAKKARLILYGVLALLSVVLLFFGYANRAKLKLPKKVKPSLQKKIGAKARVPGKAISSLIRKIVARRRTVKNQAKKDIILQKINDLIKDADNDKYVTEILEEMKKAVEQNDISKAEECHTRLEERLDPLLEFS